MTNTHNPIKHTLTANVGGHPYTMDGEIVDENGKLTPLGEGLLARGFQKILTDAHSTATRGTGDDKRKATDAERQEDVEKRLAKLMDGTYVFGGGGGGKATSPEAKAMKHTLQQYGVKFGKGKTVESGLRELAAAVATQNNKAFEEGMVDDIRGQLVETEVYNTKLASEQAAGKPITTTGLKIGG